MWHWTYGKGQLSEREKTTSSATLSDMHHPTDRTPLVIYTSCGTLVGIKKQLNGRKEMFYLTTHSNTFYLWLYGVRHMVKDHSDSEKGNPLLPHGLLFLIISKGSLICIIPQTG